MIIEIKILSLAYISMPTPRGITEHRKIRPLSLILLDRYTNKTDLSSPVHRIVCA